MVQKVTPLIYKIKAIIYWFSFSTFQGTQVPSLCVHELNEAILAGFTGLIGGNQTPFVRRMHEQRVQARVLGSNEFESWFSLL